MSSLWICAVLVYHTCTWCHESYKPSVFWSLLLFELDWQTRHCSILSYAKLPIWRVIITRQSVLWRIFTVRCTVYAMAKWQAVCRCMSVTCRCCIEMPKHIIPQLTPHSNSGTLVFCVTVCAGILAVHERKNQRATKTSYRACCRMTNYELLRWLVETWSRDIGHSRTLHSWACDLLHCATFPHCCTVQRCLKSLGHCHSGYFWN